MSKNGFTEKEKLSLKDKTSNSEEDSYKANNNMDSLDDWFNELDSFDNTTEFPKEDSFINSDIRTGPAVGIAELNTLADLFEGEAPDLDESWEVEEANDGSKSDLKEKFNGSDTEEYDPGDLTDILFGEEEDYPSKKTKIEGADLSSLFEDEELEVGDKNQENRQKSDRQDSSSEYLANLFGDLELEEDLAAAEVQLQTDDASEDLVSLLGEFPEVEITGPKPTNKIKNQEVEKEGEDFKFEDLLAIENEVKPTEEEWEDELINELEVDSSVQELDTESIALLENSDKETEKDEALDDLENLLEAETKQKDRESITNSRNDFSELDAILVEEESGAKDDFEALDSLLEDKEAEADFEALDSLLGDEDEKIPQVASEVEDDFEALESLLSEEDEKGSEIDRKSVV